MRRLGEPGRSSDRQGCRTRTATISDQPVREAPEEPGVPDAAALLDVFGRKGAKGARRSRPKKGRDEPSGGASLDDAAVGGASERNARPSKGNLIGLREVQEGPKGEPIMWADPVVTSDA